MIPINPYVLAKLTTWHWEKTERNSGYQWFSFRIIRILGVRKTIEACYSLPCLAMSWGSCNHVTIKTAKDEALGCNHPFIWRISWKRNDVGVQMLNTFLISGVRDFAIGLPYPQSSTAPGEGGRGVLSVLQILTLNFIPNIPFFTPLLSSSL